MVEMEMAACVDGEEPQHVVYGEYHNDQRLHRVEKSFVFQNRLTTMAGGLPHTRVALEHVQNNGDCDARDGHRCPALADAAAGRLLERKKDSLNFTSLPHDEITPPYPKTKGIPT
jgi:hypothetical protein